MEKIIASIERLGTLTIMAVLGGFFFGTPQS
jgi:hypothetical protein